MMIRRSIDTIWPWILAGIVSGMAILTRATGLVLVGVMGLALILQIISGVLAGKHFASVLRHSMIAATTWLIATAGTVYLLLPALWVEPRTTLNKLWSWSSNAATDGHENPTFFRGIHHDDPGLAVYPVVLMWRTSPAEWLGIGLLFLLVYWKWKHGSERWISKFKILIVFSVFSLVYVAAMSVGAKKFDRYILPVFPAITLMAAHGLMWAKQWLSATIRPGWNRIGYGLLAMAVVLQIFAWNSSRPYRLDYYNPTLGGAIQAQSVLQMGWGQGGDQVIDFLGNQTGERPIVVQTSAVPSAFTYFLENDSSVKFRSFSLRTPAGWYETDYYVAGIQQTQRGLAPGYDLLEDHEPVFSVYIGGVSYFDIFNVNKLPLPEELKSITACSLTFGESVTLMQIIGRDDSIDFYFLSDEETIQQSIEFDIGIVWPDGTSTVETTTLYPADNGLMSRVSIPFPPGEIPLADASITIRGTSSSQLLPVSAPWMQDLPTNGVTHSECFYTVPPE